MPVPEGPATRAPTDVLQHPRGPLSTHRIVYNAAVSGLSVLSADVGPPARRFGYERGMLDDQRLADQWELCALGRSVAHEEHLRIARVLVRRHGRDEAGRRLVEATRANCQAMDAADRFDEPLAVRWSDLIASVVEAGATEIHLTSSSVSTQTWLGATFSAFLNG